MNNLLMVLIIMGICILSALIVMLVVLMKILENCKEVVYNLNAKSNQNIIPVNINENARISSMEKKDISKSKTVNDNKQVENITYENKYDLNSMFHLKNIIPAFNADFISDFKIEKDKKNKKK